MKKHLKVEYFYERKSANKNVFLWNIAQPENCYFFFISQLEKFTVSRPLMKTLLNDPAS